jgi:hypothetical protein
VSAGCSTAPIAGSPELKTADYGSPPVEGYKETVVSSITFVLKDAESARYEFREPYRAWFHVQGIFAGKYRGTIYGYTVPVFVNAKNSYGGYTGFKEYKFFFSDNELIAWKGEEGVWRHIQR